MLQPRGTLSTRRMTAHWVVIAAAVLTTLVTAVVGAAQAVFAGQALPLAVRHDLSVAPGTALSVVGPVGNGQAGAAGDDLRAMIGRALGGVPFTFWAASWSDPLGLMPGALPARPASTAKGNTPLLRAAAMSDITSHAVLVSGRWPSAPGAAAPHAAPATADIPAALPTTAAALLHVSPGDLLMLRDRANNSVVSFRITGLFAPRQLSGTAASYTAASYWALNAVPASGSSTLGDFTTYGPLLVSPATFTPAASSPLTGSTGSWVAQPDMGMFTDTDLSAISGDVSALQDALRESAPLSGTQLSTSLPSVLNATASNLSVARSLLVISALQLLVLAVAAGETALLIARGATRWQLTRLTAGEVIPLCGVAVVVGGLIGIRLATLLATAGPLRATGLRLPDAGATWLDALGAAVVVAVIAVAALLAPGASAGQNAGEVRVRRGRQSAIAGATRAGADLALFGLRVGSSVAIAGPQLALTGESSTIALKVAGIVAVRDPASTFWSADPTLAVPGLEKPPIGPTYWFGGVFALPGEIDAVQQDFGTEGLNMQWTFPITFGSLSGDQARPMLSELRRLAAQTPAMTGPLAPIAGTFTVGSGLTQALTGFISAALPS